MSSSAAESGNLYSAGIIPCVIIKSPIICRENSVVQPWSRFMLYQPSLNFEEHVNETLSKTGTSTRSDGRVAFGAEPDIFMISQHRNEIILEIGDARTDRLDKTFSFECCLIRRLSLSSLCL